MPISLRDAEYALAVARHGAVSAAAQALGLTQPTLSKAVQRVEAEFGIRLFERTAKGVVPTPLGSQALAQLRRLEASHADTRMLASELRAQRAGLLRLGVTDASGEGPGVGVIGNLLAQRPGTRVQLQFGRSDALLAQLSAGELDAAIVPIYEEQTLPGPYTWLGDDPMCLVVRRGHPLARHGELELADLLPFGWELGGTQSAQYRRVEAVFSAHGLPSPRVVLEAPFASAFGVELVVRSDLISVLPASFLRRVAAAPLKVLAVPELQLKRKVVLVTRNNASSSYLLEALRDVVAKYVQNVSTSRRSKRP